MKPLCVTTLTCVEMIALALSFLKTKCTHNNDDTIIIEGVRFSVISYIFQAKTVGEWSSSSSNKSSIYLETYKKPTEINQMGENILFKKTLDLTIFDMTLCYLQGILMFFGFGINKLNHNWFPILCRSDLYKNKFKFQR